MNHLNQYLSQFCSIGLLGYGVEGKSSYRYIRKYFNELKIIVFDDSDEKLPEKDNAQKHLLKDWVKSIGEVDLWIKSPGIPWSELMEANKEKMTSQSELFLKYVPGKKIGITGSLGKSTTSQYIYDALKFSNKQGFLGGNIGQPLFNFVDYVCDDDVIVMELSSYQLKNISSSPDIAVLLNMFPDHLDFHLSCNDYFESKSLIGKFQNNSNVLIYNKDISSNYIIGNGKKVSFTAGKNEADINALDSKIYLENNQEIEINEKLFWKISDKLNLCAVVAVLLELGMNINDIENSLDSLSGLEFRLEFSGKINAIEFFNDSISTIPESTINAIKSVKDVDCLIIGGFDRGIDQKKLLEELLDRDTLKHILCLGDTGKLIHDTLKEKKRKGIIFLEDIKEVFHHIDKQNNIKKCVFSPGAPSFGMYKNFIERGQAFHEALMNWKK
ncbi:MAG: UDP-N-acetylmuramoyl-L-alanine--D-glutamate ligase [Planctomycetota bacterium]|nr:MAG: UDP-N-acetylmuramoyl-L-alanine--D-glutamate ligase [Planctomycetota bacterium]